MLERDRHDDLIAELREAGARVRLIRDGDVAPAIAAAQPGTGVDMLYGIGGTPEGVISAAALKCVGGGIQGRSGRATTRSGAAPRRRLDPTASCDRRSRRRARTSSSRRPASRPARSCAASATADGAVTDSIVMRSRSGTVRRVVAQQSLAKLSAMTGFEYT